VLRTTFPLSIELAETVSFAVKASSSVKAALLA